LGTSVLLFVNAAPLSAQEPSDQTWTFYGAVYGWLSGITGEVSIGTLSAPINEEFSDIAENVDFGISARFEAYSGSGWALFGDVFYANLGGSGTLSDTTLTVVVDQKELIFEAGAGYEIIRDLELLAVVRYNDMRLSVGIEDDSQPLAEGDLRWVDLFGGVRYTPTLGERWLLALRAEVGGGGSDFSWFGAASVAYWFNPGTSAVLSWRALSVDREEDNGFRWDVVMHGLALGVLFTF
jgi:hypothetical protein